MADGTTLLTFALAALALNLTPGPDMLYVMGRAMGQGRAAGAVAALGIGAGVVFHILAAALGLAALFELVPVAYLVVKYLGAAYLAWLGLNLLRGGAARPDETPPPAPLVAIFRQGVVTNVLNPKVALFFIAFLPQFVAPEGALGPAAQMTALGLFVDLQGTLVNLAVAGAVGLAGDWLRRRRAFWRWQERLTGALFIALACRLVLPERR